MAVGEPAMGSPRIPTAKDSHDVQDVSVRNCLTVTDAWQCPRITGKLRLARAARRLRDMDLANQAATPLCRGPHRYGFLLSQESAMLIAISTTKDENGLFSKQ
jgi:hypothetical protein